MKCRKCKNELDRLRNCCEWQLLDKFNGDNIILPDNCIKASMAITMDTDCQSGNMFYCFNKYYTFFSFDWIKSNQS